MNIDLTINEGEVISVYGPASIEVISGEILIAGASFTADSRLVISKYRGYDIKALKRSVLKVTLGSDGLLEEVRSGEVINSWLNTCDDILKHRGKVRVILLGPPESGKTSLTTFIANRLISEGREVYVVDADIGQADIATPCAIGVAKPKEKFLWLRELQPTVLKYVGCNSPQFCPNKFIAAFHEVIYELTCFEADLIVNTDGWVLGRNALELKELMIKALRPTHIVVLDEELYTYFKNALKCGNAKVLMAPRPKFIRERDKEDRRYLRHHSYMKFFNNSRRVKLSVDNTTLIGFYVLNGKPLNVDGLSIYIENYEALRKGVIYCSLLHNTLNIVFKKGFIVDPSQIICSNKDLNLNIVNEGDESGLLVGILNSNLRDVSVGIIDKIDYVDRSIYVITPWKDVIGGLVLGKIKLNERFEEIGKVVRCIV